MLKVYFQNSDFGHELQIAFIEERADGKRYIAKNVDLIFKEYEYGDLPTLRIAYPLIEPFLKALAEGLDKQGIKTENDFKIQGLLEATKIHLEDMRKLVFKK